MASSITSQVATALIAQGKAAVEAELARIETDIANAVTRGKTEAATLAASLAVHLDSHAAEVSTANALLARTAAITGAAQPASGIPAKSLTASRVKAFLATHGWRGYVLLGAGVLVLHYLWTHKIL